MELSNIDKLLLQQFFVGKPVKKAYLFGSYSRREATPKSDIDILVELDHSRPIGMQFFVIQNELEDLLQKKIDLVSTGGISKYILPTIDREKILIYDRTAH
ncbi:MAG TPA: nucleotidyltransferase domain-containing protein [Chitinophagaceae bacterium]|jgi:hypothetical protein